MSAEATGHPHLLSSDEAGRSHAQDWIDAWNAHDLDRIMALYAAPLRFQSPLVVVRTGRPDGLITDLDSLRSYFGLGLRERPDLRFELEAALRGATSLALIYRNPRGRAVEVMSFNDDGKIIETRVHYLPGLL